MPLNKETKSNHTHWLQQLISLLLRCGILYFNVQLDKIIDICTDTLYRNHLYPTSDSEFVFLKLMRITTSVCNSLSITPYIPRNWRIEYGESPRCQTSEYLCCVSGGKTIRNHQHACPRNHQHTIGPSVQSSFTSLQSLCYSVGKNRSNVPSRKVTIHCPAPRCYSLMERPMATSERKRGYWQLKTENRRVYIVEQKKYNSDFCSS